MTPRMLNNWNADNSFANRTPQSMYDVVEDSFQESTDLMKRSVQAMRLTWDRIAPDCLVDNNGRTDESKVLSREDVIELVLDSNRMEDDYVDDFEAACYAIWAKRFNESHYIEITREAFCSESYGY